MQWGIGYSSEIILRFLRKLNIHVYHFKWNYVLMHRQNKTILKWTRSVHWQSFQSVTCESRTAYPSKAPEFTPSFVGVCVARCLLFCVMFSRSLLFVFLSFFFWSLCCLSFSFGHCVVCLFLLAIVLSVLRITASDCPFGIFKLFLRLFT